MIGINLGSLNTSISYGNQVSKNKYKYDILLSGTSKRTCPSILTFTITHRLIGDQANLVMRKHLNSSFKNLSRYIGIIPNSQFGKQEMDNYYLCGSDFDRSTNVFKINSENLNLALKPESIVLAFLNLVNQKYIIEQNLLANSYVFGVPDYFTCYQKNAYNNTIKALNLRKDFHIINESTAITLYFGYKKYKEYFVVNNVVNNNPNSAMVNPSVFKYVIFIDCGYSKTSFTLSKLTYNLFTVLKNLTIPFLGGRDFDEEIFKFCAQKFYQETKIDITNNKKIKLRLLDIISKSRKNLTVNQDVSISCDNLSDDYDFSLLLTRTDFENIIQGKLNEFKKQLNDFYTSCLKNEDNATIAHIEMAGETMRTPILQKIVKDVTGIEISKGILTDECIAIGCSLYGCIMRGTFPIQEFKGIYHVNNYPLKYYFKNQLNTLVEKNSQIPFAQNFSFQYKEIGKSFQYITFFHPKESIEYFIPTKTGLLVEYKIDGKQLLTLNSKFKEFVLVILADNNGFVSFRKAKFIMDNQKAVDLDSASLFKIISANKIEIYSSSVNEKQIINNLNQQEQALFKIDQEFNEYFLKLNMLEGKCYDIRNKVTEKKMEERVYKGEKLIDILRNVENVITDNREIIIDLTNIKNVLDEILLFITPGNIGKVKMDLITQIKKEQAKISKEHSLLQSGKPTRLNSKQIENISNILNHFETKVELCDDLKTFEKLKQEFLTESSKF